MLPIRPRPKQAGQLCIKGRVPSHRWHRLSSGALVMAAVSRYCVDASQDSRLDPGMNRWIVTVKLPKGSSGPHDPKNKVTGPCPMGPGLACSDVTGEHHSMVWSADTLEGLVARVAVAGLHLTRIHRSA